MREILFRGRSRETGEWVQGYLMRWPWAAMSGDKSSPHYIFTPPANPDELGRYTNVETETVGQYTGFRDRNGERIFEDDVIHSHYDASFPENVTEEIVVWHGGGFAKKQGNYEPDPIEDERDFEISEIVGTIWETPAAQGTHDGLRTPHQ